jgi:chromosome segregation ATPase
VAVATVNPTVTAGHYQADEAREQLHDIKEALNERIAVAKEAEARVCAEREQMESALAEFNADWSAHAAWPIGQVKTAAKQFEEPVAGTLKAVKEGAAAVQLMENAIAAQAGDAALQLEASRREVEATLTRVKGEMDEEVSEVVDKGKGTAALPGH